MSAYVHSDSPVICIASPTDLDVGPDEETDEESFEERLSRARWSVEDLNATYQTDTRRLNRRIQTISEENEGLRSGNTCLVGCLFSTCIVFVSCMWCYPPPPIQHACEML